MSTIKKCLFPVAGYGTRFLPATKAIPKEMLPILVKPLLQYAVEEALESGITNMALVTGRGKRAIEDHFDDAFELEHQLVGTKKEKYLKEIKQVIEKATFAYVRQQKMLGLGHAVLVGETLIGSESFALILADDLCVNKGDSIITQMTQIHKKYPDSCIIGIEEVDIKDSNKYGMVSGELIDGTDDIYRVKYLVEKPTPEESPSNLAVIGRYILIPEIFDSLRETSADKNNEIQLTDALTKLSKQGKVIAYKFHGKRFDCGSVEGFVRATNYHAIEQGIL